MKRLFVTGDIHGSYTTWLVINQLISPEDVLVVAGDLFGTRYGNYNNQDFQPESIKREIQEFAQPIFYVYGNCDIPDFFPGYDETLVFESFGKTIFLHHGDKDYKQIPKTDIIIQGHTHVFELKQTQTRIFMNPGSLTSPRNGIPSYGIIEHNMVAIFSLQTQEPLISFKI